MRIFTDDEGRIWEVVAGRESWGAIFAIFIPRHGEAALRQAVLDASRYEEGTTVLDSLDDGALQELLDRSTEKEMG